MKFPELTKERHFTQKRKSREGGKENSSLFSEDPDFLDMTLTPGRGIATIPVCEVAKAQTSEEWHPPKRKEKNKLNLGGRWGYRKSCSRGSLQGFPQEIEKRNVVSLGDSIDAVVLHDISKQVGRKKPIPGGDAKTN